MGRRTVKKLLRRAQEALERQCFGEAEGIYGSLLNAFEGSRPSLLDHAGCLWGLVRTLHASGQHERAEALAAQAVDILAAHDELQLVA